MSNHTVYAVASGKGGVGKTTTAVNLGVSLARRGHSVVVVDVDLGMANLARFIGLEPGGATLHDVLADEASVQDATYQVADGFAAVPCGEDLEGFADADPKAMSDAVETLREAFEIVLLDVGAGLSHDTVLPLGVADWVLLVTTPNTPAVVDTARTLEVADLVEGSVGGAVLTRAEHGQGVTPEDVEDELDTLVLVSVPHDPAVPESIEAGVPLLAHAPDSPATEAYEHLADVLTGDAKPRPELPEPADAGDDAGGEADAAKADADAEADGDEEADADDAAADADEDEEEADDETDADEGEADDGDDDDGGPPDDGITIPEPGAGGDVSFDDAEDLVAPEDVVGESDDDDDDGGFLDKLF